MIEATNAAAYRGTSSCASRLWGVKMKLVLRIRKEKKNSWRLKLTATARLQWFHWGDTDGNNKYIGSLSSYLPNSCLPVSFQFSHWQNLAGKQLAKWKHCCQSCSPSLTKQSTWRWTLIWEIIALLILYTAVISTHPSGLEEEILPWPQR